MSVPVSVRSSGCRSSRERVAMLASGLMCIDFFVAGDDLTSPFPLSLKQTDPGAAGFFWRSAFSSYLRCWHVEESEHLGSGDTKGPFLAFSHAGTNVQTGAQRRNP